jgi:hypothetical protein
MPDAFDQVVARHDPAIRKLARKLRALVRKAAPRAEERVHPRWHNVAWYANGMFCYLQPQREWVNLGFNRGTELPATALLEGAGKGMRHVKVRPLETLPAAALTRLVKQAYALQSAAPKVKLRAPRT